MFVQRILPTILVVIPAAVVATVHGSRSEPAVDQCKTKPGLAVAKGTHWYYRLDHVTKRQCWYLGSAIAGQRANANASEASAAAPTVPVPQQKPATVQTLQAPQRQATDVRPPEPASTSSRAARRIAGARRTGCRGFCRALVQSAADRRQLHEFRVAEPKRGEVFTTEQQLRRRQRGPRRDALQIPMTWPVVDAVTAQPSTSIVAALQPLYLAGAAVMALLFLAGWSFGQFAVVEFTLRLRLSCRVDISAGDPGDIESTGVMKIRPAVRSRPTPTDPARDLKKSLGELMRDLQRAGAAVEARPLPLRKPKRRTAAAQNARLLETVG